MPSNISVVIATTVRMPAIQSVSLFSGRVIRFTDNKLAAALESIQLNHPRLIAIEALLAQTPAGKGFIERVERLGLRGSAIHLIVQSNGKWTTTPYNVEPAAGAADAGGAHADRKAAIITTPAAAAAALKGANTRRAHRFKVLESLNAVVENKQANLVNISILGAQVVSQPSLRPNDNVKIALPDGDETVRLTAHVAWSVFEQARMGSGNLLSGGDGIHRRGQGDPRGLLPSALRGSAAPVVLSEDGPGARRQRVTQGLNCSSFCSLAAMVSASRRVGNLPTRTR